jgi:hypothetical protein
MGRADNLGVVLAGALVVAGRAPMKRDPQVRLSERVTRPEGHMAITGRRKNFLPRSQGKLPELRRFPDWRGTPESLR